MPDGKCLEYVGTNSTQQLRNDLSLRAACLVAMVLTRNNACTDRCACCWALPREVPRWTNCSTSANRTTFERIRSYEAIQDSKMPWNDPHVAAARFWALPKCPSRVRDFVARTTADVIARKSLKASLSRSEPNLDGAQSSTGECPTDGFHRLAEQGESEEASTLTSRTQRTKTQSSRSE